MLESESEFSEVDRESGDDGGDAGRGAVILWVTDGSAGICGCRWAEEDENGGRPEELEGTPVGSVARGKLGSSNCERFLCNGAEAEKWGVAGLKDSGL